MSSVFTERGSIVVELLLFFRINIVAWNYTRYNGAVLEAYPKRRWLRATLFFFGCSFCFYQLQAMPMKRVCIIYHCKTDTSSLVRPLACQRTSSKLSVAFQLLLSGLCVEWLYHWANVRFRKPIIWWTVTYPLHIPAMCGHGWFQLVCVCAWGFFCRLCQSVS